MLLPHQDLVRTILSPPRMPFRHPGAIKANLHYQKSYRNWLSEKTCRLCCGIYPEGRLASPGYDNDKNQEILIGLQVFERIVAKRFSNSSP
jgi:hypothetical protein